MTDHPTPADEARERRRRIAHEHIERARDLLRDPDDREDTP